MHEFRPTLGLRNREAEFVEMACMCLPAFIIARGVSRYIFCRLVPYRKRQQNVRRILREVLLKRCKNLKKSAKISETDWSVPGSFHIKCNYKLITKLMFIILIFLKKSFFFSPPARTSLRKSDDPDLKIK